MATASILLFVKAPVAGKVKTRLAADIGATLAAQFAQLQFEVMLRRFIPDHFIESWIDGDINHSAFDICHQFDIPKRVQRGKNLGDKMLYAMQCALEKYKRVVIIGSDCIGVNEAVLNQALRYLDNYDMVFVPADDGGFVLWASKVHVQYLFDGIQWGSVEVWSQLQTRLMKEQVNYLSLASAWDIDTLDDIKQYQQILPTELHQFLEENAIDL